MIEEGDQVWTLMVSYLMQKDTDDDGTASDDGRRIGDARDLAQSALLSALRSERESVFELEETMMSLQLNSTALSDVFMEYSIYPFQICSCSGFVLQNTILY